MSGVEGDGLVRRTMNTANGVSDSKIESARKFLYDEDEDDPYSGSSAFVTPSVSRTNLSETNTSDSFLFLSEDNCSRGFNTLSYRGKKLLAATVVAFICIGCVWGITGKTHGKAEYVQDNRIQEFHAEILELGLSSKSAIETIGTPQYHAVQWLANVDGGKLEATDTYAMQRYALAVFFYSTAGTEEHIDPGVSGKWIDMTHWMTDAGFCRWQGVICVEDLGGSTEDHNRNGDVYALDLAHNGLDGLIPPELSALTSLHRLDLSQNNLTGRLPKAVIKLNELRSLLLRKNKLTGTIPAEYGVELTNLRQFNLGVNQLTGTIPNLIEHMIELRSLGLDKNKFQGTIPDLEDLSKIKKLYLNENNLVGIFPASVSKLTTLVELNLSGNHLTGVLPSDLVKLTKLELMYLSDMNLRGTIPADIFNRVTRLTELAFANNGLTGQIPTTIGRLKDMQGFFLSENKFTGSIPRQVGLMADLKKLHLQGNKIGGSIPNLISALNNLEEFKLGRNSITGSIPPEIGNLHRLVELHVESNQLEGKVPTEMGSLVGLKQVRLYENNLTGTVPEEVCTLTTDEDLSYLGADCANDKLSCTCCTQCL